MVCPLIFKSNSLIKVNFRENSINDTRFGQLEFAAMSMPPPNTVQNKPDSFFSLHRAPRHATS